MSNTDIELFLSLRVDDLLVLIELSQAQSIREIARRRRVDPSTISRTLAKIEAVIGRKLFERTSTGVILNDPAQELVEKSRQLLSLVETMNPGSEMKAPMGFGSNSFLSTRLLAACADSLVQSNQQIRFLDFAPDELISAGLRGAFQVALHFDKLPWPETWSTEKLSEVTWHLYCRKKHPLAEFTQVSLELILNYAFVFPVYWGKTEVVIGDDQFPVAIYKRKKNIGTSTAETAYMIIQNSDQLAYLPTIIAEPGVTRGEIIRIDTLVPPVIKQLYLTVKSDSISSFQLREIRKALLAELQKTITK